MTVSWDPIEFRPGDEFGDESIGSKEKRWVRNPTDGSLWLVKSVRTREDGTQVSDDWAEWVVHHLAGLIGVPSAQVRPTTWDGARAIASRSVLADAAEQLMLGNNVMSGRDPSYQLNTRRLNPGYTPAAVRDALITIEPSPAARLPVGATAFHQWAGYLVLDAWTAARDRHHENWGIITRPRGPHVLAPSFDHGNALGFAEPEQELSKLLDEGRISKWCERGRSHHFAGRPTLVDVALEALALCPVEVQRHWISQLAGVDSGAVASLLAAVPAAIMSGDRSTFVTRLLAENRRRLLDGYSAR